MDDTAARQHAPEEVSPVETLFIAYNDETDSTRANHVRKQLLASGRFLVEGYSPFTSWSKTRNGSSLTDLKTEFDKQFRAATVTAILVGDDAATNPWIRYAIEQSYVHDKAMFGLDISQIPDEYGDKCHVDINPLERFAVIENGQKIYLHTRYASYTWQTNFIEYLTDYLVVARASARKCENAKNSSAQETANYRNYESMRFGKASA